MKNPYLALVLDADPGVEVSSKKVTAFLPTSAITRTKESALRCAVNGGSIEKCAGIETNLPQVIM
jgi:hypothetical protein